MKLSTAQAWSPFLNGEASHIIHPASTPTRPYPTPSGFAERCWGFRGEACSASLSVPPSAPPAAGVGGLGFGVDLGI